MAMLPDRLLNPFSFTIILFLSFSCSRSDNDAIMDAAEKTTKDSDSTNIEGNDILKPEDNVDEMDPVDNPDNDLDTLIVIADSLHKDTVGVIPPDTIGDGPITIDCSVPDVNEVKPLSDRGVCNQNLSFSSEVSVDTTGEQITITSNAIPDHAVGLFGRVQGALNPNAIAEVKDSYTVDLNPTKANTITRLLDPIRGPQYEFGVLLNGVLIDPEAAEPWPHNRNLMDPNTNFEWNLDAMSINLGLDCNNAHVQPTGKYHHHGAPTLYIESLKASTNKMTLLGIAADGFPIYNKYGYVTADDKTSNIKILKTSYRLKTGERPGDGTSAPCGEYSGIYTRDYEYVAGLGDLDECNGREGVTPEFPDGTYYYVITDEFPFVSRCLVGTPSNSFRLGGGAGRPRVNNN